MHRLRFLGGVVGCLLAFAVGADSRAPLYAQASATFDAAVEQSLRALITQLDAKINHQATGDQSLPTLQGPFNPALGLLGGVKAVSISAAVPAQGLLNVSANVSHERGTSEWTLGSLATGQIVIYSFAISTVHPSDSLRGPQATVTRSPPTDTPPAPPTVDPRVVEFLFVTNRQKTDPSQSDLASYSGERSNLSFGAASVRIPDDHKIGQIELPSSWSLFGLKLSTAPNDHEHFIIKSVVSLSEDQFGQLIRAKNSDTALIFVHGFNTTFEDALYRNAQIIWDLQYNGLSILFTWPSRGGMTDYIYDKDSAYYSRAAFITLLQKLERDYGIKQVNVLAHSMGNLIVLDALAGNSQTSDPVKIEHLIMAAPDIDRDQFKSLAPEVKAIANDMTLYASSADRAMDLSRHLAGGIPRAGDVPSDGPVVLPHMETVDVTAVGDDIFGLNHNVFAASRDVMDDIFAMLRFGLPPPRLTQIHPVPDPPSAPLYWRYVP